MLFHRVLLSAALLLAELECATAKAITLRPSLLARRTDLSQMLRRSAVEPGALDTIVPREARPQQAADSVTAPVAAGANVTAACIQAVSNIHQVANAAGIVACYDLPYLNVTTGIFSAELHLYSLTSPSGQFANVPQKDILFTMAYSAASISSLTKRIKRETGMEPRQASSTSAPASLQISTFVGAIDKSLTLNKLNTTELVSLFIPTITLEARSPSTSQLVTTTMAASDIAFFPTDAFSTMSQSTIDAADNAAVATEAKTKATGFVLPGTSLGIFPTGLIVTGSWTVLFLVAFGLGTLGRIHHRHQYRQRIANPRRRVPKP